MSKTLCIEGDTIQHVMEKARPFAESGIDGISLNGIPIYLISLLCEVTTRIESIGPVYRLSFTMNGACHVYFFEVQLEASAGGLATIIYEDFGDDVRVGDKLRGILGADSSLQLESVFRRWCRENRIRTNGFCKRRI